VYHLSNLRILSLSQNQLTAIPDKIGRLSGLVELKVGNNSIGEISDRVLRLRKLRVCTVGMYMCM
jgi:Leucine-rich repeat (LRR) protein